MDNAENRLFRPWDRECVGRRLPPQDLNVRNERQEDTESVVTSTSASPALSYIDDLRSRGVFYFMHFGHHMTMSDPPLFPVDLSRMELNGPLTVTTTPAPSFPPFAPIAPFAPIPLPLYPSYLEFASPETRETIEAYWDRVNKDGYDANAPAEYLSDMEAAVTMVHQEDMAAKEMKKMRPKKFVCDTCNVAFSNKGQLRGHLRIHTGERPYHCNVENCGKSFTRNEELTRHKRIHTGLRPHACVICGKKFGRKDHLKKHTRIHGKHETYRIPVPLALLQYSRYYPDATIPPSYFYSMRK